MILKCSTRKTRFFQGFFATLFLPFFLEITGDRALSQTPIYPSPIPPSERDIFPPVPRCFPNLALPPRPILLPAVLFLPGEELFGDLALEYSRLGKQQQVLVLLENITRNESKVVILLQLAEIYRERENFADAIGNLDRALAILRTEENMRLLAFIALEFIRVGQVEKSLAIARDLDETWQANLLQRIAFNMISTGQIERVHQMTLTLTENRDRIEIWSEIFRTYFEEDPAKAVSFLQQIPDECDRDRVIYKAIERGWDGGENARELLDLIESSRMQELSRIKIATHLAESGRFEQALVITESISAFAPRARALIAIAASLRQNGQEERAAQILDRARKITENLGRPGSWGRLN
ncbi:MAG: hypothetical protein J7647_07890 [Cyanobacteria bacterium SBLK]|nr:hypothetical protein [Cyanobacteria bacterium SBLK]